MIGHIIFYPLLLFRFTIFIILDYNPTHFFKLFFINIPTPYIISNEQNNIKIHQFHINYMHKFVTITKKIFIVKKHKLIIFI